MMEVGRLCVKIAGRDAGMKCVIVDIIDNSYVTVDGETRRRKCNIKHLEPLEEKIEIKKGADHTAVVSEFKKIGIEIKEKKSKETKEKPKKQKKAKKKPETEKKVKAAKKPTAKTETKKETKPKTEKKETKKQ